MKHLKVTTILTAAAIALLATACGTIEPDTSIKGPTDVSSRDVEACGSWQNVANRSIPYGGVPGNWPTVCKK